MPRAHGLPQSGAIEGGIRIHLDGIGLGHDDDVVRQVQLGGKAGAFGPGHAMRRPRPALAGERAMQLGMPVARGVDRQRACPVQGDQAFDWRDHLVAMGDAQAAAGKEVDLEVDDQEGIALAEHDGAHETSPFQGRTGCVKDGRLT
jgi:hypothetical protein